jgi:hypothetical protein
MDGNHRIHVMNLALLRLSEHSATGSLTFQIIRSGLQHLGADPYSYRLVEGVVIFVAMYVDALKSDHAGTWRLRRQDQYDGLERLTSGNPPK